jgi:hypothetical protein
VSGPASVLVVTGVLTLCGLGVLALLGTARSPAELLGAAGLAPLAGMAWVGVACATLATLGARLSVAGLVLLTLATAGGGALRMRSATRPTAETRPWTTSPLDRGFLVSALVLLTVLGVAALAAFHDKPLAEYDGWAIWGMKARALAELGSAPTAVFAGEAYERLHLEYPLLLPSLYALPLQAAETFTSNTMILQSLAIGVAGLVAIWALLRDRVRPGLLVAFVAATAAMPAFFGQLGTGYADVPLAVFVGAGLAAAARWLVDRRADWLVLSALFFAAAALTKNEGLLFAASAYVALFVAARGRRRAVALAAAAVALAYAPWRAYVAVHDLGAPDYDLSSTFDVGWVADRIDRAPAAAEALLVQMIEERLFGLVLLLGIACTALALLAGARQLAVLAGGFAGLSLAGLTWIYVLSPYELSFFLSTNKERVVMSLVVGLGALSPLLVEESCRALARGRPQQAAAGSGQASGAPRSRRSSTSSAGETSP